MLEVVHCALSLRVTGGFVKNNNVNAMTCVAIFISGTWCFLDGLISNRIEHVVNGPPVGLIGVKFDVDEWFRTHG